MAFNLPYQFKVNNTVVIQHRRNGNFNGFHSVACKQNGTDEVRHDGAKGLFAQWHCEKDSGNVKFKSVKTGKYLRIEGNNNNFAVNAGGTGGSFCVFRVHQLGNGIVKLQGTKTGKYLAFHPQKGLHAGEGGDFW